MNTELNMKRTKQFVASALVLAFSIVIAACSGESSSSPNNSGNATGSSDSGDGGKVGDGKVVVLSMALRMWTIIGRFNSFAHFTCMANASNCSRSNVWSQ